MTRREFEAILVRRPDVHPNMDAYCLAEDPHFVLEGVRYHLVCGEGRGHAVESTRTWRVGSGGTKDLLNDLDDVARRDQVFAVTYFSTFQVRVLCHELIESVRSKPIVRHDVPYLRSGYPRVDDSAFAFRYPLRFYVPSDEEVDAMFQPHDASISDGRNVLGLCLVRHGKVTTVRPRDVSEDGVKHRLHRRVSVIERFSNQPS